jgi:hypothetical protein
MGSVSGASADGVHRPRERLVRIDSELRFDNDPEDGRIVDEQDDGVGPVLGRNELVERRLSQSRFSEARHGDAQQFTQEVRRELGLLTHQGDDPLVEQRRHRGNLAPSKKRGPVLRPVA